MRVLFYLSGVSRLLESVRPLMYIAVGSSNRREVTGLLHSKGYVLFDGDIEQEKRVIIEQCCQNTLAVPQALASR